MSIANLFGGLANGFSTYLALKQAAEEKQHQRVREGIEDSQWRDRMNLDYQRESEAERARQDEMRRYRQNAVMGAAKDAGIVGVTPDMLEATRNSNQTQSGTGAGYGGESLIQNGLQALQRAQSQPGFDPSKQVDLGGGIAFQGPSFGKEPEPHFAPVPLRDNEVGAFDNRSGMVRRTGVIGREPVSTSADNPRNFQDIQTPDGYLRHDKIHNTTVAVPDATAGGQARGSLTVPGQPERDAASAVAELQGVVKDLQGEYAKNGYQAPGFVAQQAMRHGGAAGNALVGAMDPKFQSLYNKQQFALNNLLYLKSGKVITDNEFARLRGFIENGAGDTPQTIQDKLARFDNELSALAIRAGRAQGMVNGSGGSGNQGSSLKQKYGLE